MKRHPATEKGDLELCVRGEHRCVAKETKGVGGGMRVARVCKTHSHPCLGVSSARPRSARRKPPALGARGRMCSQGAAGEGDLAFTL